MDRAETIQRPVRLLDDEALGYCERGLIPPGWEKCDVMPALGRQLNRVRQSIRVFLDQQVMTAGQTQIDNSMRIQKSQTMASS